MDQKSIVVFIVLGKQNALFCFVFFDLLTVSRVDCLSHTTAHITPLVQCVLVTQIHLDDVLGVGL